VLDAGALSSVARGDAIHATASDAPLRIAVFVNEFPALSETFVLNQITGLIDLGHDVTIFANRPRDDTAEHADIGAYGLRERLVYRGMPDSKIQRLLGAPARLAPKGGLPLLPRLKALDTASYSRDARSLALLYWSARLLEQPAFDVIHCHFGIVGRVAAFLRETGAIKGRLSTVFHGVDVSASLAADPNYYRHLFRHGDLFLPISQRWQQALATHGCPRDRIAVHRMGIDTSRFAHLPRTVEAGRPLRVLTLGRLVEKKGVEYGIRAAALLRRHGVALHYSIVGDGPLRPELETLVRDLDLGGVTTFHGWKAQHEVIGLMREAHVLLAPSVTDSAGDQEGIPVTLMEAMATGLPVVSTEHSGIPELVIHGETGLLAPERNARILASLLRTLASDPVLYRHIAQGARRKVVEEHDIAALNRQLERRFRALKQSRPALLAIQEDGA
jgi:colanic acid/amylovoran biosynthesis glycosyltransferase